MNASSDAAEQVVRLTLEGTEFAVKIVGKGAKEIAAFLYAAMRGSTRTKGKTRLTGMLRSGKELKVFSLKESDLKKFAQEAKKYGVLYAALKGVKKSKDGMVDIMVKAEDASKINRIFDRFSIAAIDTAEIKNEILRAAEERAAKLREAPDRSAEVAAEQEQASPTAEKPHRLVTNLFKNTTPKGSQSQDPFWDQSAMMLLLALVFYLKKEAPPEEQNFPMVLEMIRAGDVKEDDDNYMSPLDVLFERLKYRDPNHLAVKYYKSYRSGSGKTLKSIQITLIARLEKFNLSSLEAITQSDDLELWSVGEKKTAIFAVIPDNDSSFNFLVGMLYTQLFQQLYNQADFVHGGRLPVHVHFLMDEFANVALPDDFDKLLATMRSREISVSIIIQNLAQLKALFEKQWESIVGNCDEFLYLGGNEKETHKYISELLGKETIDLNTYGQSHGRNGNYSTNWQLSGRELMTPDEVRLLDNRLAILFIRGERPIIDEKFDILRHPNVALSADGGTKPYIHGFADCAGVSIIPETDNDESKDNKPAFELPDGIELLDLELLSEEEILQEINENERNESNNEKHD